MWQIRLHGRGGQGVVTAAEMLSVAAFAEGRHAQAFPSFGSERTGAPVVAFARIDTRTIRTREPIAEPDAVIVQDATLLGQVDVAGGLTPEGYLIVNSDRSFDALGIARYVSAFPPGHVVTLPATELSLRHLGANKPGAVMLAGLAALTGWISLDSVVQAITERFSGRLADGNVAAAREAFAVVTTRIEELVGAHAD